MFTSLKTCFKCGQSKPRSCFYKHSAMKDGLLGKCKECTKLDVVTHRANNLERFQQYDRSRSSLSHRKQARIEYQKRFRRDQRHKYQAHQQVARAIKSGDLIPKPCEKCGAKKVDAHHDDYTKPLDVRWLCVPCHHAEHRKYDYEAVAKGNPEIRVAKAT